MPESDIARRGIQQVDVRGRHLAVQIRGSGPTVVMEMGGGFGGIGPYWCVDGELAKFCRVLVYDRAGLGDSARIHGYPTMIERAQDLAALLDALDIRDPALFVGWSLGGLIVENFSALYPERVGGLLLIDPTPPDLFGHFGPLRRWAFSAAFGISNRILLLLAVTGVLRTRLGKKLVGRLGSVHGGPHLPAEYRELMLQALAEPPLYRAMILETGRMLDACRETNRLIADHGLPRVPSIVLAATHRPGMPETVRTSNIHKHLLDRMPGAEMRELPETGHLIPAEAPDSVIRAVRDLLAQMAVQSQVGLAGASVAEAVSNQRLQV